jgi:hypothetical protein
MVPPFESDKNRTGGSRLRQLALTSCCSSGGSIRSAIVPVRDAETVEPLNAKGLEWVESDVCDTVVIGLNLSFQYPANAPDSNALPAGDCNADKPI